MKMKMKIAFWKKIFPTKKEAVVPPGEGGGSGALAVAEPKAQKAELQFHPTDTFFAPRMTEKTNQAAAAGRYVFKVSNSVNKPVFARAVMRRYGVSVVGVRMLNMPGKERRRGRIIGWKPGFKKAVVTLKKGEKIEIQ